MGFFEKLDAFLKPDS